MSPDAGGSRDAIWSMAEPLSQRGFAVLVPDIFYRLGPWEPFDNPMFAAENAKLLGSALIGADVEHTVEFYPAHHRFAVPDVPVYDLAAADRHWAALERLSSTTLTP